MQITEEYRKSQMKSNYKFVWNDENAKKDNEGDEKRDKKSEGNWALLNCNWAVLICSPSTAYCDTHEDIDTLFQRFQHSYL